MTMESYFTKYIFKIDLSIENSQGCNGFRNIYIRTNIFKYNYFLYDLIFSQIHVQTLTLCAKIRAG